MITKKSYRSHETVRPEAAEEGGTADASANTFGFLPATGLPQVHTMTEYAVDTWQRSVLYADVMRQRGNQYQAHLTEEVPTVLDFPSEVVLSGQDLPRPVNYWLVRIVPPKDKPADNVKRPFVVIDPRAGHGPGIGGFKVDSEIGVVIDAGHPCYFIGFLPDPVPGQTIEDVMHAQAAFMEKVLALHPCREGKPAVIGNCQAGWQILMTAAMRPELFGPIIVAGAPLSYWAGWRGRDPMRYTAGLLGGYVFLNDVEMQYIVDNLFIGNRLATAQDTALS